MDKKERKRWLRIVKKRKERERTLNLKLSNPPLPEPDRRITVITFYGLSLR